MITNKKCQPGFGRRTVHVELNPAISQTNALALLSQQPDGFELETVGLYARSVTGSVTADAGILPIGGVFDAVTLAIGTTKSRFRITTSLVRALCVDRDTNTNLPTLVYKAAEDNILFSTAWTVNAAAATGTFFGACRVQMSKAGVVSTKVVSANQTFLSSADAVANCPAADPLAVDLGTIVVQAVNIAYTANTTLLDAAGITATYNGRASSIQLFNSTPATPLAGRFVYATRTASAANRRVRVPGGVFFLRYTTDGTGALADGEVILGLRPYPQEGEL